MINEQMIKGIEEIVIKSPKFKMFAERNKGKTMEEVARAYGIDPDLIRKLLSAQSNNK